MSKSIFSKDHRYLINQLKRAREEAGLDQTEVARKLSKTQSYVSKIESGQRRIDLMQLKEFAKVYRKNPQTSCAIRILRRLAAFSDSEIDGGR